MRTAILSIALGLALSAPAQIVTNRAATEAFARWTAAVAYSNALTAINEITSQTAAAIATRPTYQGMTNMVDDAIVSIPRVPTNAVTGWLLYDAGSNKWLRISVSNYSYYISEVL